MDDLISRAAACACIGKMIKEYREKGEDDLADGMILARRYGIKRLPAIDAIPMEWLRRWRDVTDIPLLAMNIDSILKVWEESNKYWGEVNKGKEAR